MKKINTLGFLGILLVATLSLSLALAAENESNLTGEGVVITSGDNGSSLDEQVPSSFMQGWERFKLNFVRNQTIKAERELQLARWKISEAKIAAKNGNINRAERAMEAHDAIMQRFQERIANLENNSLTPGLDNALQVHEDRLANLNLVLESSNLTDAQRARIEDRISKMENLTANLEGIGARIQERRQDKIEELKNRSSQIEQRGDRMQERLENRSRNNSAK